MTRITKTARGSLLASVAVIGLSGAAHAGVIDISGQNSDGGSGTNAFGYNEADTGTLTSITFDLSVEHFSPSWGSETRIELTHTDSGYNVVFAGSTDFGWAAAPGVFAYANTVAIAGGPLDMSGAWTVDLYESFADGGVSPDATFGQGSTITLNGTDRVPEPGPLGLIGAGLVLAALRRRKRQ